MAWSGTPVRREWHGPLLPSSRFDYVTAAGPPERNGAVAICLGWIGDNFPEAELGVRRIPPGPGPEAAGRFSEGNGSCAATQWVPRHPLSELLRAPNPAYDGDALLSATAMSYAAHGNAYWVKVRDDGGRGRVRELWFVPHWQMEPLWPEDGSAFLTGYRYRVDGRELRLPPEDVVHFRFGLDPENPRLGLSRVRALAREIFADNEASTYLAAILRNMGVPGAIISSAETSGLLPDEFRAELQRQYLEACTGEQRGMPLFSNYPLKVERLQLGPEDLALDRLRQFPEDRICGALRISPMVVGLTAGAAHKTYANYTEARRAAYEDCLVPMQRRFARTLDAQLLPDLGHPETERCGWEYAGVAALREELTEVYRRNDVAVRGGWMTPDEARARVGLPPMPAGSG